MSLNYAFLVLEEHPYGLEMLRVLLEDDLAPNLVIQEVSQVAEEERQKFLARIAGQPVPPRMGKLLLERSIPLYSVAHHNHEACWRLLDAARSQVVVLGGTRILKGRVLEIAPGGILNAHPGLLPWLRGSASVGWALYKNLPVGATVHFVDPGIDTGDIVYREELPVLPGDTYESLNARVATLAGQLMKRALLSIITGDLPRIPQDRTVGETLKVIPDDLLAEGKQRLADGAYAQFSAGSPSHGKA